MVTGSRFFGISENAVKTESGSPSRSTCSWPSSRNGSISPLRGIRFYRFSQ
jgi:hypothetical protein